MCVSLTFCRYMIPYGHCTQVEKVLDSKWFKMERERYPDGFDPAAFLESQDDEEGMEDDGAVRGFVCRGEEGCHTWNHLWTNV